MYTIFKAFIIILFVVGYSITSYSQQDSTNDNVGVGYLIGNAIISYPLLEKKIASHTHQGLCMRKIIRESQTTSFNIAREMDFLKDQLQTLSGSHVVAMINDTVEDIRQEAIDIKDSIEQLENDLLNDCPEQDGIF